MDYSDMLISFQLARLKKKVQTHFPKAHVTFVVMRSENDLPEYRKLAQLIESDKVIEFKEWLKLDIGQLAELDGTKYTVTFYRDKGAGVSSWTLFHSKRYIVQDREGTFTVGRDQAGLSGITLSDLQTNENVAV